MNRDQSAIIKILETLSAVVASSQQAQQLLRLLPHDIPAPEVTLDGDGEFSLEWYSDRKWTFGVSVGPSGKLSYAGVFGPGEKTHGVAENTDPVPAVILDGIRRVVTNG